MRIGRLAATAGGLAVGFGIAPTGPAALVAGYQPPAASTARTASMTKAASTARTASMTRAASIATAASTVPLCGSMAGARPHITKVMWIFMENRSYGTGKGEIPGDPSAQYIDGTLIGHCGSTSDYHAITHASFPNYLAATSGGLHGDGSQHSYSVRSIFSQVDPSWRSYEEFMPVPCDHVAMTGSAATGYYVGRHNPADSYSSLPVGAPAAGDCSQLDEPLGTTTSGALQQDVAEGTLPGLSFLRRGLCDAVRNSPAGVRGCADDVKGGDSCLARWPPTHPSGPGVAA